MRCSSSATVMAWRQASAGSLPPRSPAVARSARVRMRTGTRPRPTLMSTPRASQRGRLRPLLHPHLLRLRRPSHDHPRPLPTRNNRQRPGPIRTVEKCLSWPDDLLGHDRHVRYSFLLIARPQVRVLLGLLRLPCLVLLLLTVGCRSSTPHPSTRHPRTRSLILSSVGTERHPHLASHTVRRY